MATTVETIPAFSFDSDKLCVLAARNAKMYRSNKPFPHIVIDDFMDSWVSDAVLDEFPGASDIDWTCFNGATEKKLATTRDEQIRPFTRHVLSQFNSAAFIQFLETLTGIRGLVPDPYFEGGGLHQIERSGFLKVHADFNWHRKLELHRRLNLLLYLNKDWKEEYGGHLELWNNDMSKCEKRLLPVFNRCVVFNTTDFSYHGHPDPVSCPDGMSRKSLALYYYSRTRPREELTSDHSTLWRERPGETFARGAEQVRFKSVFKLFKKYVRGKFKRRPV